jgi:putative ABC transport system permease protein
MRRGAIIAVESDKEDNLFKTLPPTKGNKLTKEERYGVYISETLANRLHLSLNETVIIVTTIAGKAMNALDFIVKGVYSEANFAWASYKCFINLEAAQELLNMEDEAMQLVLFVKDTGDTNRALNTLYKELKDKFDLKPWFEANKDFRSVLLWSKSFLSIMSIFLLVLIIPQIANTSLLILYERIKEIGTLRAIGASAFQVVSFVFAERIALFLIAVSLGTLGGFLLHCYLAWAGIPLSGMLQEAFGGSRLYTYLSVWGLFGPGLIIFIISILSSLYPILWACKIKPVEALRHV